MREHPSTDPAVRHQTEAEEEPWVSTTIWQE